MWVKCFTFVGALAGAAGVALGALSAHALRDRLAAPDLATLDSVSRYLLLHGLLLLVIGGWLRSMDAAWPLKLAGVLACAGIVLFCGGLGVSILSGVRHFGAAAPVGGSALIGAWLVLALFALLKL